jgi:glucose-6-phosphate 1-epimerase
MSADSFQPMILRASGGATAKICTYGAHLISWCAADGVERLFTSSTAEFRSGAAIRGGVPIIFPQFAGLGALPKHGFARTALWRHETSNVSAHQARLQWCDDRHTRAIWPHAFAAEIAIELGSDSLTIVLEIQNTGNTEFSFTAALHTYLRVQNIDQVSVMGLQGLRYRDSTAGGRESQQTDTQLRIAGEVDRIYLSASRPIQVVEPGQRTIECRADGFADAVIWNPGAEKGAALADLEPAGYRRMLCVEAAAIAEPIVLQPGDRWSGAQHLLVI